MSQTPTQTDGDVGTKTEIAADRIRAALSLPDERVLTRNWDRVGDLIILSLDNHHRKAHLIDAAYESGANVKLYATDGDEPSLKFEVRDK